MGSLLDLIKRIKGLHNWDRRRPRAPNRLLSLPPELRNEIWALVFQGEERCWRDLMSDIPPQDALLQVSRQVHQETKAFYEDACARYFRSAFYIHMYGRATKTELINIRKNLETLPDKDIKPIRTLVIRRYNNNDTASSFIYSAGEWEGFSRRHNGPPAPRKAIFVSGTKAERKRLVNSGLGLPVVLTDGFLNLSAFTFLWVREGWATAPEVREVLGLDGLTKKEIAGAVRWFQDWG